MKRCAHFMPLGKCVIRHCPHWDGYKSDASAARSQNQDAEVAQRLAEPEQLEPGKFRCNTCTLVKDAEEDFYSDADCKRGHQARCKECDKARGRVRKAGSSLGDARSA